MPYRGAFRHLVSGEDRPPHQQDPLHHSQGSPVSEHLAYLLLRQGELKEKLDNDFRSGSLSAMLRDSEPPVLEYLEVAMELFVLSFLSNPSTKQVGLICHYLETYFQQLQEAPSEEHLLPSEALSLAVEAAMSSSARRALRPRSSGRGSQRGHYSGGRKKRRRRKRITSGEIEQLLMLKTIFGARSPVMTIAGIKMLGRGS